MNALLNGPLLLPTLWGLFSRKIGLGAVWFTIGSGFLAAFLVKFGLSNQGFLTEVALLQPLVDFIASNKRIVDLTVGIVCPFSILVTLEMRAKNEHPGWQRVTNAQRVFQDANPLSSSTLPARMVILSLIVVAFVMAGLALFNGHDTGLLFTFSLTLFGIAGGLHFLVRRTEKNHITPLSAER